MGAGNTSVGSFGYVAIVDKNGNVATPANASTPGQQTSTNSQSVVPASDSDFAKASNQTNGSQLARAPDSVSVTTTPASASGVVIFDTDTTGFQSLSVAISGTFTANARFEGTNDSGTTWFPIRAVDSSYGSLITNSGSYFVNYAGVFNAPAAAKRMRLIVTSYTSGTINSAAWLRTVPLASGTQAVSLVFSNGAPISGGQPSDGLANNPIVGQDTRSFNFYWNGTTHQRALGDSNGAWMVSKGGSNINTGQAAVTTSSTLVTAARANRQKITLSPTTSTVYYVGNTGVTTTTGLYVAAGGTITLDTTAAIYAVGASAVTISYIEYF